MGHQIWSYETLDKLCMDAFTAPKFGFTPEQLYSTKSYQDKNLGSIALSNHPFMLIMVAMLRLVITFMPIWIAFF